MNHYTCLLGKDKNTISVLCNPGPNCRDCGWERTEDIRRHALIQAGVLKNKPDGTRGLILKRRDKGV